MVFFNYALRKLNAKIVYYGPGLCGKTTNLVWVHDHFEGGERGKMISLATEGDRTIFFDLLPLEIGSIRGMNVTLQLYTVPGQVHYNSTRQLVLRGADGVVFVADSQRTMRESNVESFRNLQENLLLQGISLDGFPLVLQFNKRDLKDILSPEELDADLNLYRAPFFEATATQGVGVQETLEGIVKLVMRNLRERYEGVGAGAREAALRDPAATMRAQPPQASSGPRAVPPKQPPVTPPPAAKPSQPVRPPAAKPSQPQRPQAVKPPPARPQPPEQRAVKPPTQPSPQPPRQQATPPAPRPTAPKAAPPKPAAPPAAPKAPVPKPAAPKAPAPPPKPKPPAEEVVFPEADGSITFDFSENDSSVFGDQKPKGGFEDEVSTAVYEDEIEVGPEDFKEAVDSRTAAPPRRPAPFVDEPTKTRTGELEDLDFARLRGQVRREPEPRREEPEPTMSDEPIWPSEPASEAGPYEPESYAVDEPEPAPAEPPAAPPEWVEPELEEGEIQFLGGEEEAEDLPPAVVAPVREVTSSVGNDRYVDKIQAPSPFAPREPGPAGAVEVEPVPAFDDAATVGIGSVEFADLPSAGGDLAEAEPVPASGFEEISEPEAPVAAPVFVDEELFSDEVTPVDLSAEGEAPPAIVPASRREVDVRAEDNQLHLRLQGTGAIVESGQVRALDIEVPVPGAWVGHRRVTLQLRLTLTPDSEAEDGGSGGHS